MPRSRNQKKNKTKLGCIRKIELNDENETADKTENQNI